MESLSNPTGFLSHQFAATVIKDFQTDCPLDFNRTAFTDFVPPCVMF